MPKTQASKDLQRERLESFIEDLLARYPYLIAPGLPLPRRQVWITKKDRVDLYFESASEIVIVEIKKTPCSVISVRQLMRYLDILSEKSSGTRGFLIGPQLSPNGAAAIQASAHKIQFLQLEMDIPTQVLICRDCRRACHARRDFCSHCGSRHFLD